MTRGTAGVSDVTQRIVPICVKTARPGCIFFSRISGAGSFLRKAVPGFALPETKAIAVPKIIIRAAPMTVKKHMCRNLSIP